MIQVLRLRIGLLPVTRRILEKSFSRQLENLLGSESAAAAYTDLIYTQAGTLDPRLGDINRYF